MNIFNLVGPEVIKIPEVSLNEVSIEERLTNIEEGISVIQAAILEIREKIK